MTPKTLCPELSVDKQISLADVADARRKGFRAIINNRPDHEEPGQPTSAEIAEAAREAGLAYVHIPVVPGKIDEDDVEAFSQALETLPHPILGFCKTGTRACMLWGLCRAGKEDPASILDTAAGAGYDISALAPRLDARGK